MELENRYSLTKAQIKNITAIFITLLLLSLTACASGPKIRKEHFEFAYGQDAIVGVLQLPDSPGPHPVVVFVHGDGDATWNQHGYYTPLQKAMVSTGFAVLSWDKPGVGKSTGNWLSYSMQDRANIVTEAGKILKSRSNINPDAIGLWGISQAGWVMPRAIANSDDFAFMISVSGAINWKQQGRFYMRNRLEMEGYDESEISEAFEISAKGNTLLESDATYEEYTTFTNNAPPCCRDLMSKDRWQFVKKNIASDARPFLQQIQVPVLAIFGDKDLNVDIEDSVKNYREYLTKAGNHDFTIKIYKNADHGIMPAKTGQISGRGSSAYKMILKIELEGANAFAPGYIDYTVDWLSKRFAE